MATNGSTVPLTPGAAALEISTQDTGIAVDNVLVTNDPDFMPNGRGQVPEELAAVPKGLHVEPFSPEDQPATSGWISEQTPCMKLAWQPVDAPQGVAHYNVYRSDSESFEAQAKTLLGSPSAPVFYDVGLQPGQTVYYRVRAVDAWGNQSPASAPLHYVSAR